MTQPIQSFALNEEQPILTTLEHLKQQFQKLHLNNLFAQDEQRFEKFSVVFEQLVVDFSKHRIDQSVLEHLIEFAETQNLGQWIKKLFPSSTLITLNSAQPCIGRCVCLKMIKYIHNFQLRCMINYNACLAWWKKSMPDNVVVQPVK